MSKTLRLLTLTAAVGLGLAAVHVEAATKNPETKFGATFAKAFAAKPTAKPIDPKRGDAGKASWTADPVDF